MNVFHWQLQRNGRNDPLNDGFYGHPCDRHVYLKLRGKVKLVELIKY